MRAIVDFLLAASLFISKRLEDGSKEVGWFSVLNTQSTSIGLTDTGFWAVEGRNGLIVLNSDRVYRYAISLLEMPFDDVCKQFQLVETEIKMKPERGLIESFPFSKIVLAGLKQESDYWADLAFNWYDEIIDLEAHQFTEVFSYVVESKWASQKNRDRSKAALKKLSL